MTSEKIAAINHKLQAVTGGYAGPAPSSQHGGVLSRARLVLA
jgi:hypothetical protein